VTRAAGGFTVTVYNGGSSAPIETSVEVLSPVPLPLTYGSVLSSKLLGGRWLNAVGIEPVAPGTAVAGRFLLGESEPTDIQVLVVAFDKDDNAQGNVDRTNTVTVSVPM
jgi:hypothetical protein